MKTSPTRILLAAAALLSLAALSHADIERLDLAQMMTKADDALLGTITKREVFRVDHPKDGPELYFTTLTIEGRSLKDDRSLSVNVMFMGGFIDRTHGVYNSAAPSADEVKIGNRVVAFYKWTKNMGGDVSGNALCAWHGGLYRTFDAKKGVIVQGRGAGYAIPTNVEITTFKHEIAELAKKPK